ncbi:hypothetical protein L484_024615 [Morus notabilis]|uniref:Uncharacterized protein n=1 Tax=Morus notabilis TaxID=981085 RepID=W9QRY7_9ROSA|nr:hypothetical protein L484_024615 [Morus notabilis]
MVRTHSNRTKDVDSAVKQFQEELKHRVTEAFRRSPLQESNNSSQKLKLFSSPSSAAHREFISDEEIFSTPRGSPTSTDGAATAPENPPNLMRVPPRPGFPSWTSRFPPTRKDSNQNPSLEPEEPLPKCVNKRTVTPDNDETFTPQNAQAESVEQLKVPTEKSRKREKQKKVFAPTGPSRVTRSKSKQQEGHLEAPYTN